MHIYPISYIYIYIHIYIYIYIPSSFSNNRTGQALRASPLLRGSGRLPPPRRFGRLGAAARGGGGAVPVWLPSGYVVFNSG